MHHVGPRSSHVDALRFDVAQLHQGIHGFDAACARAARPSAARVRRRRRTSGGRATAPAPRACRSAGSCRRARRPDAAPDRHSISSSACDCDCSCATRSSASGLLGRERRAVDSAIETRAFGQRRRRCARRQSRQRAPPRPRPPVAGAAYVALRRLALHGEPTLHVGSSRPGAARPRTAATGVARAGS